jgi:hypothetical protein
MCCGKTACSAFIKHARFDDSNLTIRPLYLDGFRPEGFSETFCTDHWRCRFKPTGNNDITKSNIIELLNNAMNENIDSIKTENLYSFDGKAGYSLGQGQ